MHLAEKREELLSILIDLTVDKLKLNNDKPRSSLPEVWENNNHMMTALKCWFQVKILYKFSIYGIWTPSKKKHPWMLEKPSDTKPFQLLFFTFPSRNRCLIFSIPMVVSSLSRVTAKTMRRLITASAALRSTTGN